MEQAQFPFIYSKKVTENLLKLIRCWWCKYCVASPEGCHGCYKNIDDPFKQPTNFKKRASG